MKLLLVAFFWAVPYVLAGALQADENLGQRTGVLVEVESPDDTKGSSKKHKDSSSSEKEEIIVIWINSGGGSATTTINSAVAISSTVAAAAAATHSVNIWCRLSRVQTNRCR